MDKKRLLIINAAGLGYEQGKALNSSIFAFKPLITAFPAVTCSVQAVFRTALPVTLNNVPGNGFFERSFNRPFFWEQSAELVTGARIWQQFRERGGTVGLMFWQQSLGEAADLLLSPAPIHKHHGGMIQDCYSRPAGLYGKLCAETGATFDLKDYWGPLASTKSTRWITEAACALLNTPAAAPDLLCVYLPLLDYDLQRFGPHSDQAETAVKQLGRELEKISSIALSRGYDVLIFGDYVISTVNKKPIYPNLLLKQSDLFAVRKVKKMYYPDFYESRAFALVDHEIAHIYCRNPGDLAPVRELFTTSPGIGRILDRDGQAKAGAACPRAGDFILVAEEGSWFAYPWWENEQEAPDYARHVDIHNKPGYDPCELLQGWPPFNVSLKADRIKGTHGVNTAARPVGWAFTGTFEKEPDTLSDLALCVKAWLESPGVQK